MAEYIDREELLLRLKKVVSTGDDFSLGMQMATSNAIECIKEAPAADVEEVKHGEWGEFEDNILDTIYQCSVCKEEFVLIEGTPSENLWKYCPNCGAKMDGKESEDNE